jgi:hypothetical protein
MKRARTADHRSAARLIDNCRAIVSSQQAAAVASIKPSLDRAGEAFVIFLFDLRRPRFRMKLQPTLAFVSPFVAQFRWNRVGQSECDEVNCAALLPMRQAISGLMNFAERTEESEFSHLFQGAAVFNRRFV